MKTTGWLRGFMMVTLLSTGCEAVTVDEEVEVSEDAIGIIPAIADVFTGYIGFGTGGAIELSINLRNGVNAYRYLRDCSTSFDLSSKIGSCREENFVGTWKASSNTIYFYDLAGRRELVLPYRVVGRDLNVRINGEWKLLSRTPSFDMAASPRD